MTPGANPDPAISTRGLRKAYGPHLVLDGVDFDVRGGEAVALLGANGAGKTTLLRIAATLVRPTSGRVLVAGADCARDPEAARRQLGFLGHGSWLYDDLTASRTCASGPRSAVSPRARRRCGPRWPPSTSTAGPTSACASSRPA